MSDSVFSWKIQTRPQIEQAKQDLKKAMKHELGGFKGKKKKKAKIIFKKNFILPLLSLSLLFRCLHIATTYHRDKYFLRFQVPKATF